MSAIYKRELRGYFSGMTGYIFIALMLAITGVYSTYYNFKSNSPNFEYALYGTTFIFLILVPILTMRSFAEERQSKTDQLLYSLPMKLSQVVVGKYLAMLTVYAIPLGVMCFYPLILSTFGPVSFASSYAAILAYFLLGAALLAIGMFMSTLTESQAIAAVLAFGALLAVYLMSDLASLVPDTAVGSAVAFGVMVFVIAAIVYFLTKSSWAAIVVGALGESAVLSVYLWDSSVYESAFSSMLNSLSMFNRFTPFLYGVFDIGALVYFVSVACVFVFFSMQSLEKRRWS